MRRVVTDTVVTGDRVRMSKDARRAAVLDQAITIIGEQGFRGFSINELAKRCGLTTAGLLHHFGSKDGMLVALLKERDRRDEAAVAGSLALRPGDVLERQEVMATLRAIVERNAAQPHLVRLYAVLRAEALIVDHPARDFFLRRERGTIELFSQLVEAHVAEPDATALQIMAVMNGLEVQWLREDCQFDLVAAWDRVAEKLVT